MVKFEMNAKALKKMEDPVNKKMDMLSMYAMFKLKVYQMNLIIGCLQIQENRR